MSQVKITQVRSGIGQSDRHLGTLRALGLGKIGRSAEHKDSPQLQGQLRQVRHLVTARAPWFPLGATANKPGRVAGANAAGGRERFAGVVGTSIVGIFGMGLATTGSVMVPCPWFPEIARIARERPDMDLGGHLTLTSEWDDFRWRPLTGSSAGRRSRRRWRGAWAPATGRG